MDELWHAAILDTRFYADLQGALGVVLHHRPYGASEQESEQREKRLTAMKAMYKAFFSTHPLEYIPPQPRGPQIVERNGKRMSIFVNTISGKTISMNANKQTTIGRVKSALELSEGIPVVEQRLYGGGFYDNLTNTMTLEDCDIEDGDRLDLHRAQMGC